MARRERHGASAVEVCDGCFRTNPRDEKLMEVYCRNGWQHFGAQKRLVTWSANKMVLVAIRPLPDPPLQSGRYVLCNREETCRRPRCTFAHSQEEMVAWNTQLYGMRHQPATKISSQRPELQQTAWPTLRQSVPMTAWPTLRQSVPVPRPAVR